MFIFGDGIFNKKKHFQEVLSPLLSFFFDEVHFLIQVIRYIGFFYLVISGL